MTEKSAEPHTIAPRLSIVEDKLDALAGGTDTSAYMRKLWLAAVYGAQPGALSDTPWTATDLIYGPDSTSGLSMHQTLFGTDSTAATSSQDGKGFYGWTYRSGEARWNSTASGYTLSTDIFDETAADYVPKLRANGQSLCEAVFGSSSGIPSAGSSIAELLDALTSHVEDVRADLQSQIDALSGA